MNATVALLALALAALAAPAVAPPEKRGGASESRVEAKLSDLRTPRGVCASDFQGTSLAAYVRPEVCLRTGSPGKASDDRKAWLFVDVETDSEHAADVREWEVTAHAPDGKVAFHAKLAGAPIQKAGCSIEACNSTFAAIAMRNAWRRGTYRFRLVYGPDPDVASELVVTLK